MTVQRERAYAAIDKEREYHQTARLERGHQSPRRYLEVIEYYVAAVKGEPDDEIIGRILRIAAVAVCALEDNGPVEIR